MAATQANTLTRISSGIQDARLLAPKGNPSDKQFVKVLRKTTRWATQWRRVDFDGAVSFGKRVSLTIPRAGELLNGCMLAVTMPDIYTPQALAAVAAGGADAFLGPTYGWTNALGHALIERIELEIGGATVEVLDGRLMEALDELYEPLETLRAKNRMIARAATGFGPSTWKGTAAQPNITVYVPIPFWFSRPGVLSHALPIDAIQAEKVRVHITFRGVEQLYYTDARMHPGTVGFRVGVDMSGAMPALQGGRFWKKNPAATTWVYNMNAAMPRVGTEGDVALLGVKGELLPAANNMPANLNTPVDAYMMLEYVSLEDPEAIGLRSAELTYFIQQHNPIQFQAAQRIQEIRIPLPLTNMTKEIVWVLQRPEAEAYNAWFLFTRDLSAYTYVFQQPAAGGTTQVVNPINPCLVPWWPDAVLQPLKENRWRVLPGFRNAESEPITGASVFYNSYERFTLTSGSLFRSVLPTLHATKAPVIDRYVYMWPFGVKPKDLATYQPHGAANWDKIPRKEMYLSLAPLRNCEPPPVMNVYVWTTAWNVLKVFGGRAGLLFTS